MQKHLPGQFARLGVHTRREAVELAWAQVGTRLPVGSSLLGDVGMETAAASA